MKIVLYYKDGCFLCEYLIRRLTKAKVKFKKCNNIKKMLKKGITSVPQVSVDGQILDRQELQDFLNNLTKQQEEKDSAKTLEK